MAKKKQAKKGALFSLVLKNIYYNFDYLKLAEKQSEKG